MSAPAPSAARAAISASSAGTLCGHTTRHAGGTTVCEAGGTRRPGPFTSSFWNAAHVRTRVMECRSSSTLSGYVACKQPTHPHRTG